MHHGMILHRFVLFDTIRVGGAYLRGMWAFVDNWKRHVGTYEAQMGVAYLLWVEVVDLNWYIALYSFGV